MKNLSKGNLDWYLKFLYNLLICNMVAIRYVTATLGGNQVYRLLALAIEEGHVSEREIETKKGGRKHKTRYLVITKKGMEYLRENYQELPQRMQWVGKISVPQAKIQYMERVMSAEQICRFLQVSGIGFIYNMFGMGENVVSSANYYAQLPEDDSAAKKEVANKLSTIIKSAKQYQIQAPTQPPGHEYEFVNSIQLKQQLRPWTSKDSRKNLSKFVGILFSAKEAIFVYDCRDGKLSWKNETIRSEILLARMHTRQITPRCFLVDKPRAIVVMKSTGRLTQELRREKLWDEIRSFEKVMLVPLCFGGLQYLKKYLSADYPRFKKQLNQVVEKNGFEINTDQSTSIFGFVRDDRLFYLGDNFDLKEIRLMNHIISTQKIKKIGILCFKWQMDMYRQAICHQDMIFMFFS